MRNEVGLPVAHVPAQMALCATCGMHAIGLPSWPYTIFNRWHRKPSKVKPRTNWYSRLHVAAPFRALILHFRLVDFVAFVLIAVLRVTDKCCTSTEEKPVPSAAPQPTASLFFFFRPIQKESGGEWQGGEGRKEQRKGGREGREGEGERKREEGRKKGKEEGRKEGKKG
ncbi:Cyclic nucleotide-gated cation channel beta-1, partial [Ophiophagus hannah]